jgi:murein peptide amidase A
VILNQGMNRLGKNINGYAGEGIAIATVLEDCFAAALQHGWRADEISTEPTRISAFTRLSADTARPSVTPSYTPAPIQGRSEIPKARHRVYLSAGIHGDEPAGPLALLQFLQQNQWPSGLDLWVCPCLNPAGFMTSRRENGQGIDLNRDYLQPKANETKAHIDWLERQPRFDLCLCLHEDWESHGFYVYELNPDHRPSLAEGMIARVAQVCPIDYSEVIEGRQAQGGIIRPSLDPHSRPLWPEAFFLLTYKTRLSYTLEAPSDYPLPARVNALVAGVNAALEALASSAGRAAVAGSRVDG